jgi:hypothetical protein
MPDLRHVLTFARRAAAPAFATAVTVTLACGDQPTPPAASEDTACRRDAGPVRVAVLHDPAGTNGAGTQVAAADLDPLIDVVRCRGGELYVAVVAGRDSPPLRLRIAPPPQPPTPPPHDPNPVRARPAKAAYERDLIEWRQKLAQRDDALAPDMAAFTAALGPLLAREPQGASDIWPAVRGVRAYFIEPGLPDSAPRVLLAVSGRERGVYLCPDNKGNPTAPPGFELTIVDSSGGATVWVCGNDGVWHAKHLLPTLPNGAVDLLATGPAVPAPPSVPLPLDACVLVVKARPVLGPLDERANCGQWGRTSEAIAHLVNLLK